MIEDILNYVRVSDRIATSGQPTVDQFRRIVGAGFEVVVNLAMPDSVNAIADEKDIVESCNMEYVHIPVPFDSPGVEHLKIFFEVMSEYSKRRLWVHCALNYRVSAFIYQYYRLIKGEAPEQARKHMFSHWEPNPVWRRFMVISFKEIE